MADDRAEWRDYWFRQPPSASAYVRDVFGRKMEAVVFLVERRVARAPYIEQTRAEWENYCSVSFRQILRTSLDVRDACGR